MGLPALVVGELPGVLGHAVQPCRAVRVGGGQLVEELCGSLFGLGDTGCGDAELPAQVLLSTSCRHTACRHSACQLRRRHGAAVPGQGRPSPFPSRCETGTGCPDGAGPGW